MEGKRWRELFGNSRLVFDGFEGSKGSNLDSWEMEVLHQASTEQLQERKGKTGLRSQMWEPKEVSQSERR